MKLVLILILGLGSWAAGAEKSIRVFVALCDNRSQGIAPVPPKIGNGDDPDANLYWGCDDGLGAWFRHSRKWKVTASQKDVSPTILRRLSLTHVEGGLVLVADAYRGSEIRQCLADFEKAAAGNEFDLVAYLGHNGLMDMEVPETQGAENNRTSAIVLCCLSDKYFGPRLEKLGCQPLLLTQQLMYPGAFLLHDAIEVWRAGGSRTKIRDAAGAAYARNQKISLRAATNVFANISK